MKLIISYNNQFIIISLIWLVSGIYTGGAIYAIIPIMLLLMAKREMHLEMLLGFFYILILSDSRLPSLQFAVTVKNIYLLFISLVTFNQMRKQSITIQFYKYLIPFFCLAAITIFLNPDINLSFQKTLSYILFFIFVPNYILIVFQKYGFMLFKSLVYFVGLILVLGLLLNITNPEITNLVGRFRGLLGNPNGLGLFAFLFILVFFTLNEHFPELFTRNEKIVIYGLSFFCLLKCGARASLISTVLFLFFYRFYKISPGVGFVIFIITFFLYQLISDNLVNIITALGLGEQFRVDTLESGSGRVIAWKFAWDEIQNNFFIGKGFSYNEYLFRKNYDYLSKLGHEGMAHNTYLTIWLDTGLVGLVLFLSGLAAIFLKAAKRSRLSIPVLYAILFSNYYESWLTASLNPFTIQLLFILTIIFIYDFKTNAEMELEENLNLEASPVN